MGSALETIYRAHHSAHRGNGFVLLGALRSAFLRKHIGTGKRVVDIGCRDGALTRLYREGNSVLGVDIDAEALAHARATGIDTRHLDLNGDWDLPKRAFDVVVAAEIVEHLYYPATVIKKMSELLTADGVCLITVPNAFSYKNRLRYLLGRKKGTPLSDPTHINHFTVDELRRMLLAEFTAVEVYGIGRRGWLARHFPQACAFDLCFKSSVPKVAR